MKKPHLKLSVAGMKENEQINVNKRKTLSRQLRKESKLVWKESMKVLAEFEQWQREELITK